MQMGKRQTAEEKADAAFGDLLHRQCVRTCLGTDGNESFVRSKMINQSILRGSVFPTVTAAGVGYAAASAFPSLEGSISGSFTTVAELVLSVGLKYIGIGPSPIGTGVLAALSVGIPSFIIANVWGRWTFWSESRHCERTCQALPADLKQSFLRLARVPAIE